MSNPETVFEPAQTLDSARYAGAISGMALGRALAILPYTCSLSVGFDQTAHPEAVRRVIDGAPWLDGLAQGLDADGRELDGVLDRRMASNEGVLAGVLGMASLSVYHNYGLDEQLAAGIIGRARHIVESSQYDERQQRLAGRIVAHAPDAAFPTTQRLTQTSIHMMREHVTKLSLPVAAGIAVHYFFERHEEYLPELDRSSEGFWAASYAPPRNRERLAYDPRVLQILSAAVLKLTACDDPIPAAAAIHEHFMNRANRTLAGLAAAVQHLAQRPENTTVSFYSVML